MHSLIFMKTSFQKKRKYSILLLWSLSFIAVIAQSPRLYSTRQGLINTRINAMMFDRENFLWIPTDMGLARFNGQNFTTYLSRKDDHYSLQTNRISYIYEDPSHRHWVGAEDGLYYFCRTENKFTHYQLSEDSMQFSISCILSHPTKSNMLLLSTYGYGIFAFDTETRTVDQPLGQSLSILLDKRNIKKMVIDSRCHLWALHPEGVRVLNLEDLCVVDFKMDNCVRDLISHAVFHSIVEDRSRRKVWLGTLQDGIFCCDLNSMQLTQVENPTLRSFDITALQHDADGNLLVGTENKGLYRYFVKSGEIEPLHFPNCPCDLEHSKIHSIVYDDQENLWLGLFQRGVLVVPFQDHTFLFKPMAKAVDGNNLGCVSCFASLSDGTKIIGSDGGGLLVCQPDGKRLHFSSENSCLKTNSVLALASDEKDRVYVGTYNYGVYVLHNGVLSCPDKLLPLSKTRVMCMVYDTLSHSLFVGTNGHGVFSYNTQTHELQELGHNDYNPWIISLHLDKARQLWSGTEGGMVRFDIAHNSAKYLPVGDIKLRVSAFVEEDSVLWMATDLGLYYYDKEKRTIDYVKNRGAGLGELMNSVVRSEDGLLWFSTNYGLGSYDPHEGLFRRYSSDELSLVGNFSVRAAVVWPDGSMSFGGDNGMLEFRPEVVKVINQPLKEIYFTRLWVNNALTDYDPASSENVLDASLWHAKTLTLSSEINSFSLSFAVQEYCNSLDIQYAYRLFGYDNTWHEVQGADNSANYSNLPWGTYLFQVRAYTNNTLNTASFKQLCIVVQTPWYASWWAIVLYVLIAAVIILAFIHHWRQRVLHKRILIRTEHKQQIKEAKLRMFTSISHEIKTPLTLILAPLRKLMDLKVDNATASVYELMYRNALRILMLVNQQMDIRKLDNGQLQLHVKELRLSSFLSDIMRYFDQIAVSHQIQYSMHMPEDGSALTVWGDPDQLDKVFFNLLSNAFKFTPHKGEVSVTVSVEKNSDLLPSKEIREVVRIVIFNSGSSLSETDMRHIFERFYQGKNSSENSGSGIGLNIAYELAELHHGKIQVANIEHRGIEFTVLLPLGNAHFSASEIVAKEDASAVVPAMVQADMIPDKEDINKVYTASNFSVEEIGDTEVEASNTITVMLVDDDSSFLAYLREELSDYNIVTATSGNEAWGQLLVSAPDVVVTDLVMPNGDGYELCHRIKHNIDTDNIPVIVLTSETSDNNAELAMRCEADRFLTKPINITLLRGAIGQSLKVRKNILSKLRRMDLGFEYDSVQMTSGDTKLMQRVMENIRKNLSDSEFNVEKLSQEVGISRVHLNRKLKELLNTSPSALIKSVRLKQAAFLLIENDVTVAEIAYSVGFSSPSYFTSNFTSYFGMTPKAFVSNYLKNPNDEKLKKLLE